MAIVDTDSDVLPWPSCVDRDPPLEHDPAFLKNQRNQRTGRFEGAIWICQRCDRAGHTPAIEGLTS